MTYGIAALGHNGGPAMFEDANAALGYVLSQTAHIEQQVYQIKYADIQYQDLIPVDTSANPWATTVTFFSHTFAGQAAWINGGASEVPFVSLGRDKYDSPIYMAGIGYKYSLEEINQAQLLGRALTADYAMDARRAYEEFIDLVAFTGTPPNGDASKGMTGLFNNASVPAVAAPNGLSASPLWANKTSAEKLKDVNSIIGGVQTATNNVALADTLLMPFDRFNALASEQLPNTPTTTLDFLKQNNVFTATTGKPLTIRGLNRLNTAGAGGTARMVAYRRDPTVLKMHIPMPLRFIAPQPEGLNVAVPGMFRLGGLDIRLPYECRYMDGI